MKEYWLAQRHAQIHVNGGGNLILRESGNRGPRRYRILWKNGVPQRKKRIVWESGDVQAVCYHVRILRGSGDGQDPDRHRTLSY